jgi:hypothetical protein
VAAAHARGSGAGCGGDIADALSGAIGSAGRLQERLEGALFAVDGLLVRYPVLEGWLLEVDAACGTSNGGATADRGSGSGGGRGGAGAAKTATAAVADSSGPGAAWWEGGSCGADGEEGEEEDAVTSCLQAAAGVRAELECLLGGATGGSGGSEGDREPPGDVRGNWGSPVAGSGSGSGGGNGGSSSGVGGQRSNQPARRRGGAPALSEGSSLGPEEGGSALDGIDALIQRVQGLREALERGSAVRPSE